MAIKGALKRSLVFLLVAAFRAANAGLSYARPGLVFVAAHHFWFGRLFCRGGGCRLWRIGWGAGCGLE